jgi:glycosyltransferase involved in cell wall biosynthesis
MKVFTLAPSENWICDRFTKEWKNAFPKINTEDPESADIIWLLADWCWNQVHPNLLMAKKVVASVHHITPEKFDEREKQMFQIRDQFIDVYHVPCKKTHDQIRKLTSKPIATFPFWVNSKIWSNKREQVVSLRAKYNLPQSAFLIGSFQRDTEGHDLISPKLEKGPDLLCDAIARFSKVKKNVQVVLAGWRRQYVMNRLKNENIPYHYTELPPFEVVNDLYNCLDLYVVSARYEGGPQAIVECASNGTPIISTDVGLAAEILPEESIFIPGEELSARANIETAYKNVHQFLMPQGFQNFENLFKELYCHD